jgi:hypothetical protein
MRQCGGGGVGKANDSKNTNLGGKYDKDNEYFLEKHELNLVLSVM